MSKTLFGVLRIVTIVVAALFVIMFAGTFVAFAFSGDVSGFLGAQTYKIVRDESGEEGDDMYFKSAFETYDAMKEWQQKIGARLSEEGIALLKNDNNALPLGKGAKVNTLGKFATSLQRGGSGTGAVNPTNGWNANLLQGFEFDGNLDVNDDLFNFYTSKGGQTLSTSNVVEPTVSADEIRTYCTGAFASNTAGLIVLERTGGEGNDLYQYAGANTRAGVEGNVLALHPSEIALLDQAKILKDSGVINKLIVLLNAPNAIQMDFLQIENGKYNSLVDAIVWIGAVGHWGTRGIGKVLAGEANFSGRIVDSFAYDHRTNPTVANFGAARFENTKTGGEHADLTSTQQNAFVFYAENIYLGYKYYETRYEDYVLGQGNAGSFNYGQEMCYTFGSGESYTTFEYSNVTGRRVGNGFDAGFEISVDVKNTGSKAGKHVVQIYTQSPYTEYDKTNNVEKVSVALAGFEKTGEIAPGATETVKVIVREEDVVSYDAYKAKTFILEAGDYYFAVGKNAHDAVNNILAAKGKTPANTSNKMDAEGNANAVYKWTKGGDLEKRDHLCKTGVEVTNLFDHADPTISDIGSGSSVKYLSRNNWTGTFPEGTYIGTNNTYSRASIQLNVTEWMRKNGLMYAFESTKSIDESQANYFIETVAKKWETDTLNKDSEVLLEQPGIITTVMMKGRAFDDATWDIILNEMSFAEMGKAILNGFRQSVAIPSINKPATVDHNGPCGMTQTSKPKNENWLAKVEPDTARRTCGFTSNDVSAATGNKELIYLHGQAIGEDGIFTGVSGLFGPGSNIHRSPYSGRNFEYVSEDGYVTGVQVDFINRGMNSKGMYVYQKHVLLNDQETNRNGICTFTREQAIRELYAKGQRDSFQNADLYLDADDVNEDKLSFKTFEFHKGLNWGVGVMSGYNRIGCIWTGHDYNLQEAYFRGEMGGTGTFITDATSSTGYANAVAGVFGGTSLWDNNNSSNAVLETYYNTTHDARFIAAMKKSVKHLIFTQANSMAMNGLSSTDKIIDITPWWQPMLITIDVVLGVIAVAGVVVLVLFRGKTK
ncbi:MAG: glycoside hydrolase family 3 C-terminal domain-containing protein [Clostridia bacterium]|nr:glycoside hydrolase family 3 C-terminal domain-containing protein [Clostridia bacterium]